MTIDRIEKSRRTADILQHELDHDRLSPLAVAAGRALEDAFEAGRRSGAPPWSERVDTSRRAGDRHAAALGAIDAARRVDRAMARVLAAVGPIDARLIWLILGERLDYSQAAALNGCDGERSKSYYARRFRDALDTLGRATKATGLIHPKASDRYSAAAEALNAQDA